jgi:hypothetical protein
VFHTCNIIPLAQTPKFLLTERPTIQAILISPVPEIRPRQKVQSIYVFRGCSLCIIAGCCVRGHSRPHFCGYRTKHFEPRETNFWCRRDGVQHRRSIMMSVSFNSVLLLGILLRCKVGEVMARHVVVRQSPAASTCSEESYYWLGDPSGRYQMA